MAVFKKSVRECQPQSTRFHAACFPSAHVAIAKALEHSQFVLMAQVSHHPLQTVQSRSPAKSCADSDSSSVSTGSSNSSSDISMMAYRQAALWLGTAIVVLTTLLALVVSPLGQFMTKLAFVAYVVCPLLTGCIAVSLPVVSLIIVAVRKGVNVAASNLTVISFTQCLAASTGSCHAVLRKSMIWLKVYIITVVTAAMPGLQRLPIGLSQQRVDTFRALGYCWALPCLVWISTVTVQNILWAAYADLSDILQLCHVESAGFFVAGLSSVAQASTAILDSALWITLKAVLQLFVGTLPHIFAAVASLGQSILMAPEASAWVWALQLLIEATLAFACHKVHVSVLLYGCLRLQYAVCCALTCYSCNIKSQFGLPWADESDCTKHKKEVLCYAA